MNRAHHDPAPELSRREAIAAGIAITGAACLRPAGAVVPAIVPPPPPLPPPSTTGVLLGADRSGYAGLRAAAPLATGLRWYFNYENQFPPAWPHPFPGAHTTLSLRPNPSDLFSGRLDRKLKAIIHSAPPHSELTFWHENTSGNPLHYPSYVNNPRTAIRMQHYGQALCRGTRVRFGVITVGPAVYQLAWMAPGLDWYGDDLYEFRKLRSPSGGFSRSRVIARLNENLHAWQRASGTKTPALRICEANSPYDAHRAEFFATIAHWLAGHNGNRLLTFWNRHGSLAEGGLSGAWPPSRPVVRTLKTLSRQYNWTHP